MPIKLNFNRITAILTAGMLLSQSPSLSHEYWIEPINFSPVLRQEASANLKVGSDLKGQALSYVPQFTLSYQLMDAKGLLELDGAAGDRPALNFYPEQAGLNVITYQTTKNRVTFSEWDVFEKYLVSEGMPEIIERHRERGLPQTDFSESYSRYVKTLLDVDSKGTGNDAATGMIIELVAMQNPYSLKPGEELNVQLLYHGEPLPDNQISIFMQDQARTKELIVERVRTDENGQIKFVPEPGLMYLLNSIEIEEINGQGKLSWESFWTSMTFSIPE